MPGWSRQEQAVTCRAIKECSIDNCSTLQRMCQHCTVVQRCVFIFHGSCVTSNCKVRSTVTQIAASTAVPLVLQASTHFHTWNIRV